MLLHVCTMLYHVVAYIRAVAYMHAPVCSMLYLASGTKGNKI